MRSYSAARSTFSFLEFIAWAAIILGGIIIFAALSAGPSNLMVGIMTSVPGVTIALLGFFGLAYVQTSRAAVDSAEYAQQSLQVARDQVDISKQLLKLAQTSQPASTYTAEPAANELKDIAYDTETSNASEQSTQGNSDQATSHSPQIHKYAGLEIAVEEGRFLVEDKSYETLIDAQLAIDGARLREKVSQS